MHLPVIQRVSPSLLGGKWCLVGSEDPAWVRVAREKLPGMSCERGPGRAEQSSLLAVLAQGSTEINSLRINSGCASGIWDRFSWVGKPMQITRPSSSAAWALAQAKRELGRVGGELPPSRPCAAKGDRPWGAPAAPACCFICWFSHQRLFMHRSWAKAGRGNY